jgi:uncharacterized membrane protein
VTDARLDGTPVPDATASRLEAFSDGVLAIAITLLIIEVKVPDAAPGALAHALREQWPSYAAYVVSFVVIGVMWVNHHAIFEQIRTVDRGLLFVNLMVLLGIAFLPFPTALLAEYIEEGGANATAAAVVYSATMVFIAVAFLALQMYLRAHPRLAVAYSRERGAAAVRRSVVGPIAYAATIPLVFVSAPACLVVYALIACYSALSSIRRPRPDPDPAPR